MLNPVDIYVGTRLRARRKMLGLSQTKIGEMVGVTFQQIQKYETGVNKVCSSRLYQFAKILLVPINYFSDGYESTEKPTENAKSFIKSNVVEKEIALLVKYFLKIEKSETRNAVSAVAKQLAKAEEKVGGDNVQ